jgi:hypothetical protein
VDLVVTPGAPTLNQRVIFFDLYLRHLFHFPGSFAKKIFESLALVVSVSELDPKLTQTLFAVALPPPRKLHGHICRSALKLIAHLQT